MSSQTKYTTLEQWVTLHADALFRRAFFLTSHRETAEDLVQETFLAAAQGMDSFAQKSSPRTWLFGILHHKTADHFRQAMRQPVSLTNEFFDDKGQWQKSLTPLLEWMSGPENLLDDADFERILQQCLDDLHPTWRGAFLLKFLENKKGKVICQELQLTPTNFWQIIHRAKLQLRHCLDMLWFRPEASR